MSWLQNGRGHVALGISLCSSLAYFADEQPSFFLMQCFKLMQCFSWEETSCFGIVLPYTDANLHGWRFEV